MPMSFDIFSQLQGPQIDVSLFGDAATAGTNVGNAIPSPVTAAVEGFVKGYDQGQVFRARNQEAELRQAKIDDIPLDRQRKEQDIKANDVALQQAEQNLQEDRAINDPRVLQELNSQYQEYIDLQKTDPKAFVDKVQKGEFDLLFAKDRELGKLTIDRTFGAWDKQYRDQYLAKAEAEERMKGLERYSQQDQRAYDLIESEYRTNDTTKQLLAQLEGKVDPYTMLNKGSVRQVMKKDPMLDESGNPVINPATKQPFPGIGAARKAWVFELDGKEVMEVPDKFATVWGNMKTAEAFRKKTYEGEGGLEDLRRKSAAADAAAASQSQQTQQAAPEPVPTDLKARLEYRKQQQREKYKGRAGAPVQASSTVTGFDEAAFKAEITEPRVASALTALNDRAAAANPILRGQNPVVQAVALVESNGRANAVSPKGATGLMQIMPGTFKDVVKKYKLPEMDPYNVADNLKVGSIYLAEQIKRFGSAPGQGLELALAAYNTGPGRVADALRNAEVKSWEGVKAELKKVLNDKAYAEVSSYPDKVLRNMLG